MQKLVGGAGRIPLALKFVIAITVDSDCCFLVILVCALAQ